MKTSLLSTILLLLSTTVFTQSKTVDLGSDDYDRLKLEGKLDDYVIVSPPELMEAIKTTVYPAGDGMGDRNVNCGCWVEPDETYTTATFTPNNDDGSTPLIPLPFTFNLYGNNYNQMFININGNITFTSGYTSFTPSGFPLSGTPMVAPFWADVDLRCGSCGQVRYKITEDAVFVNWMEVGYFNQKSDKVNTFQVIITNGQNNFLGVGNNVAFCYKDMQWTTGDVHGSGGFGVNAPATVGANKGTGPAPQPFMQIGRFGVNSAVYDGPFGAVDGVHWLDFKSFVINAADADNNNIPPIVSGLDVCDTLKLCINQTYDFELQFISPEQGQTTTLEFDDGGMLGLNNVSITNGNVATFSCQIVGNAQNVGFNTLTFTATDDGVPVGVTSISIVVEITDVELPPLTIDNPDEICAGETATVTASPGFESYQWSNGMTGQQIGLTNAVNNLTLTASIGGCSTTAGPISLDVTTVFFPPVTIAEQPICSNDSTLVTCPNLTYQSYTWSNYLSYPGTIYSTSENTAQMSSGTFVLTAVNAAGCPGQYIFNIEAADAVIPTDTWSGAYCEQTELDFCCGFASAAGGNFWLYLFNTAQSTLWNGATVTVHKNGEPVTSPNLVNFAPTGSIATPNFPVMYGDFIEIFYNEAPNGGGGLSIMNCTNQSSQLQPVSPLTNGLVWSGYAACAFTQANGIWTINGPDGWAMSNPDQFNTTFVPGGAGVYEMNFLSTTCNILYEYEVVYSEELQLSLLNENPLLDCSGESVELQVNTTDPVGDGVLLWSTGESSNAITIEQTGNYCVTFQNACSDIQECIDVIVEPSPQPNLTDVLNCENGTVTLDPIAINHPTYEYSWTGPGVTGSDASEIQVAESGTYSVTVTNACGSQSASAEVTIALTPTASLNDHTDCNMQPYVMIPTASDPSFNYNWTGPGVNPTASQNTANQSGTYTVTISNVCGTATATANVIIELTPTASLNDYTDCNGQPYVMIPVSPSHPTFTYNWTGPGVNPTASQNTAAQSGTYTVTISNNCGSASATANVIIAQPLSVSVNNITSCDQPSGVLTATVNQNEVTFNWSSGESTPSITVSQEGTYTVSVNNGCETLTASGSVALNHTPTVDVLHNGSPVPALVLVCPETVESFQAQVTGTNPSMIWSDDCSDIEAQGDFYSLVSSDFDSDCIDQIVTVTFTASNMCGTISSSFELEFDPCLTEFINVFSPNGDGINDAFVIPGLEKWIDKGLILRVFNRWGQVVYENDNFTNYWDAADVSGGTYYYQLIFPNGTQHSSPLTIIK